MRKVATIPIRTRRRPRPGAPYTERTIERENTWTWERGRRVYELLAPDGSNYVMQSYAQISDPSQSIGDLRSLGSRLELPQGWAYRVKRLQRDLTLRAGGEATIVQDELQNTYQRVPRKQRRSKHRGRGRRGDAGGRLARAGDEPRRRDDRGQAVRRRDRRHPGHVRARARRRPGASRSTRPRGSAFGTVAMTYVIAGSEITFTGTATFTGGTGKFRGIKGTVDAFDHNTLDGQNGSVRLDGVARY